MRPCQCENFRPGEPYDLSQCRLCWLYHNDPGYEELWDLDDPTFTARLKNFAKATVGFALSGFKRTTDEERSRRLSLCQACEHFADNKCTKCGCGISTEAAFIDKLGWDSSRCPVGKW